MYLQLVSLSTKSPFPQPLLWPSRLGITILPKHYAHPVHPAEECFSFLCVVEIVAASLIRGLLNSEQFQSKCVQGVSVLWAFSFLSSAGSCPVCLSASLHIP